jgi:hypothetical protein
MTMPRTLSHVDPRGEYVSPLSGKTSKESVTLLLISDFLVDIPISEGTEFLDLQRFQKRRKYLMSVFEQHFPLSYYTQWDCQVER